MSTSNPGGIKLPQTLYWQLCHPAHTGTQSVLLPSHCELFPQLPPRSHTSHLLPPFHISRPHLLLRCPLGSPSFRKLLRVLGLGPNPNCIITTPLLDCNY